MITEHQKHEQKQQQQQQQQHQQILIFDWIYKIDMKINAKKCRFGIKDIPYLAHVIARGAALIQLP